MKKFGIYFLALLIAVSLCGCQSKEEEVQTEPEETAAVEETQEIESSASEEENAIRSYLSGKEVSQEDQNKRPLAVMFNNILAGCPQTGISEASAIYEAPMEKADITRLMGLFEDWYDLEKIGAIRSSRSYFVYAALEFDAIYAHFGQSTPYAGPLLNSDLVDNISGAVSGIDRPARDAFYRTTDRKAPHNVYSSGEAIMEYVEKFDYSLTYHDTHEEKFVFAPLGEKVEYTDGKDVTVMYPGGKTTGKANGYSNVQAYFEYNEEDGKYYRYQYGDKHIDEANGEQLAVDNVIFQYCDGMFRENDEDGYMAFNCHGGYNEGEPESGRFNVQVFTGGKMVEGTWYRYSDTDAAHYVDKDGNPIAINEGKTWICIIWNDRADDVVLE